MQKPSKPENIFEKNTGISTNINSNLSGKEIIKYISKNLPSKPGVYYMESENEEILYIGKAKNLNKRVSSYSNITNLTRRLQRMVTQVKNVSFTVTNSEIEATAGTKNSETKETPELESEVESAAS